MVVLPSIDATSRADLADRTNGTWHSGVLYTGMRPVVAWYREFAPCDALWADVYAFFTFVPAPLPAVTARPLLREVAFHDATFCSPQLADGQVSLLFELGRT